MESTVSGVGVLDKAFLVLAVVEREPQNLAELVASTSLPRATVYRLSVALQEHGLLRRDDDGRFTLGLRLIALGRAASDSVPLAAIARPVLGQLRDLTGESVQLFIRDGDSRRCVVSFESTHSLRWIVAEGALLPMDLGSAGTVLSSTTLGGRGTIEAVESIEEREIGAASVSAPVVDSMRRIVAAVCVSGPIERMSNQPARQFGGYLVEAARRVSRLMV